MCSKNPLSFAAVVLSCLLSIVSGIETVAAPADSSAARRRAELWLMSRTEGKALLSTGGKESLRLAASNEGAYFFASASGNFVIAPADDRLPAVIGYGRSAAGKMPPALSALFEGMGRTVSRGAVTGYAACGMQVGPLLGYVRSQDAPYNRYCPYYRYKDGTLSKERCPVGCVATATESVVTYYRRKVTLLDTIHGWATDNYTIPDILPGAEVDTRTFAQDYETPGAYTDTQADGIARLSYYIAAAARMQWTPSSSGTWIHLLEEPMKRIFGYRYVHYADSYKYLPEDWFRMISREIEQGRPVVYSAFTMPMSGHAFVLDGIDSDGYFHANWGNGGSYDGWFRLDLLNAGEHRGEETPEGEFVGYICNHEALFLHPDVQNTQLPDTLRRTGTEIRVDSVSYCLPPETGKLTPMKIYLTNTAGYALTTPFEVITNTEADTAVFKQADYAAYTSAVLQAGESRCLTVLANFNKGGHRILSISPDDVHLIHRSSVVPVSAPAALLSFGRPTLSFPEKGKATLTMAISNAPNAGRAGWRTTYELLSADSTTLVAHIKPIFVEAGGEQTDTVTFATLTPGEDYIINVRHPWTLQYQIPFTAPLTDGIDLPATSDAEQGRGEWHSLDGRRLPSRPVRKGIYIHDGKKLIVP